MNTLVPEDDEGFRYEKKFVICDLEYREVEHHLRTSSLILSEIYQGRRVNSIYFDTPNYKSYEEHLGGVSERSKIRIRWYGDTFGEAINPRLEVKMKQHEQCRKLFFGIGSFHVGKGVSKRMIADVMGKASLPHWLREMLYGVEPVLITSYHRRYFISKRWKCRITLDNDLKFYDLLGKMSPTAAIREDDLYVVELKCPVDEYERICSQIEHLPFHLEAYSKYVMGMQQVFAH